MPKQASKPAAGFSMIELLISLAVLWAVMAVAVGAVSKYQQSYRSTDLRTQLHQDARAALEMIAQEVGQAGLVNARMTGTLSDIGPTASMTANSAVGASSLTVSSTSAAYLFAGEQVYVGLGSSQEVWTICSVSGTSVTGTLATGTCASRAPLTKAHFSGDPLISYGVFPNGIVYSTTNSNSSKLMLIGDIYGDGKLYQVVYYWTPTNGVGPLTRKVTNLLGTPTTTSAVLLPNVTACTFSVTGQGSTVQPAWATSAITMAQSASISVTVRTPYPDRYTGQYLSMTHSMLNIQPRNLIAAYNYWGASGSTAEMQKDTAFVTER